MALLGFQQALADLIASPALARRLRAGDETILGEYDLDDRDRRRLRGIVAQPGMATNCSVYRMNRITPIFTMLPMTCLLLGDALIEEAEHFWRATEGTDLQFRPETERFVSFLRERVATGMIDEPYLDEVMDLEVAVNRISLATRGEPDAVARIRFRHDPVALLGPLTERRLPDVPPPEGDFYVVVDASGPEPELRFEAAPPSR